MTSPNIDPMLLLSIEDAINHQKLALDMKPVTSVWVKRQLTRLLKEYYTSSIDWLAFTLSRSAEDDPLTRENRMAIFLICSELMLVYRDDVAKLLPKMNVQSNAELEKIINWTRAVMTVGFLLAKEGLDNDQPIPDQTVP